MRSIPSMAATYSISSARSAISPSSVGPGVGVDVLAEQGDFAHTLRRQRRYFGQHGVERPADFSPRV